MSLPNEIFEKLRTFGFSSYQAKTYLVLALRGVMTAIEVARHSGVPKSKVYEVLLALKERGMIEEYPGSPRLYKARQLDSVLESLISEQESKLEQMRKAVVELKKISLQVEQRELKPTKNVIWTVNGRKAFHEKVAEMINRASKDVLAISANFSRHPGMERAVHDAVARGVTLKGITNINDENLARVIFYTRFATVRNYEGEIPLMVVVVDDKECLYRMDVESEGKQNYVGVHSTDPGLIRTFTHYWNSIWNDSKEIMLD
jgi:HTH-type transcriptional regulator, sugar sensing transcriptional regulator